MPIVKLRTSLLGALLAVGCGAPLPGTAAPASPQASTGAIETVVVTARKRSENLQDVPISISAYSGVEREKLGLNSAQQQLDFTPGVTYAPDAERVTIRGIGRVTQQLGTDPGVAVYQDGFYVTNIESIGGSTLGQERIEILRGPQGTLYGRNSVGGALKIISRRPTDEFDAEVRTSINNYGGLTAEGRVAGPVTDWLRASAMLNWVDQEQGWYHNTAGLRDEGGVQKGWNFEGQAAFDITPHLEGWVRYQTEYNYSRPRDQIGFSPWPVNLWGLGIPNPWFGLNPNDNPGVKDHRAFVADTETELRLHDYHTVIGELTYHAPGFDVKYLGGFQTFQSDEILDGDASAHQNFAYPRNYNPNYFLGVASGFLAPTFDLNFDSDPTTPGTQYTYVNAYNNVVIPYNNHHQAWSHEIDISSTGDGPLQWLAGFYYYNEESLQTFAYRQYCPDTTLVTSGGDTPLTGPHAAACQPEELHVGLDFPDGMGGTISILNRPDNTDGCIYCYTADLNTQSIAGFGQVDYDITKEWHITAGLRYTHDHKRGYETNDYVAWLPLGFPVNYFYPGSPATPFDLTVDLCNSYVQGDGVTSGTSPIPTFPLYPGYACPTGRYLEGSYSAVTGTAGIQFKPSPLAMYYFTFDRGYKSGGFNLGTTLQQPLVKPETLNAFEIGTKQAILPNLQLNAAAFYYDYNNQQIQKADFPNTSSTLIVINNLVNVTKARSIGLELEADYQATDRLGFLLNYSYLDATVIDSPYLIDSADPGALQPGARPVPSTCVGVAPNNSCAQDISGNTLPGSPKHKIGFNVTYNWPFEAGTLTTSATVNWHSSSYFQLFNTAQWLVEGGTQLDLHAVWRSAYTGLSILGTITNVTNAEIPNSFITLSPSNAGYQELGLEPPRIFKLELQYHF